MFEKIFLELCIYRIPYSSKTPYQISIYLLVWVVVKIAIISLTK